jgi:hypothetical protein
LLAEYDLVLVLERLEESLVLLHYMFDIPFTALIHFRTNVNKQEPFPGLPPGFRETFTRNNLNIDNSLYSRANLRLNALINALPVDLKASFPQAVVYLKRLNTQAHDECSAGCGMLNSLGVQRQVCERDCLRDVQLRVENGTL